MTRQHFNHLRRQARTFMSYAREVTSLDSELGAHLLRWFTAEYAPNADAISDVGLTCRPGRAVSHMEMLVAFKRNAATDDFYNDQKARRLSAARMARYFRKPCPLPDRAH